MYAQIQLTPTIRIVPSVTLMGIRMRMSFADNKTMLLWQTFMPRLKEISGRLGTELYSGEVYDSPEFFKAFNPSAPFDKIAMVSVQQGSAVPEGMEQLVIPEGKYAVFVYKGLQGNAADFYRNIYAHWLPGSGYVLDNRPHLAVMGEKYKKDDPESEEEILVPVS
jgi:AraC family transcriptional regulator